MRIARVASGDAAPMAVLLAELAREAVMHLAAESSVDRSRRQGLGIVANAGRAVVSRAHRGRYRSQAEYAVWGSNGGRPLAGPIAPGVFRAPVPKVKLHIAGKPVELMAGLMAVMEGPVLDPFMGSGTVGVACIRRGLPYVAVELDPAYFEVACRRLEEAVNGASSAAEPAAT